MEKIKVWTYACGGYRNVSGQVFPTYKDAYRKMEEDYWDIRNAWDGDSEELDAFSYIDTVSAEVYSEAMDADEAWVGVIKEEEIEVKIPLGMPAPKKAWVYTFRGPWRSNDVLLTFDAEDDALNAMHEEVLRHVKEDFFNNQEIESMDYDQFVEAIEEALDAAENDFPPISELAELLAEKYDIHAGAEFVENIYAGDSLASLPDLKAMEMLEWDVSEIS